MAGKRTTAIVAAERGGVAYCVHEYVHDPNAPSYGLEAAERLGVAPARVFKTLVVTADGEPRIAIPPSRVSSTCARSGKRAALATVAEAERPSGYVTGGISPLGQRRRLPTVLDESALAFTTVFVSAGRRGLELELAPTDLLALIGGRAAAIARR